MAIAAKSTTFKRADSAAASSYTTVGEVLSVNGPNFGLNTVNITPLGATHETFLPTIANSGELALDLTYVYSEYSTFKSHLDAGTFRSYQLGFDGRTLTVSGVPTELSISNAPDGAVMTSVKIKLSGSGTLS